MKMIKKILTRFLIVPIINKGYGKKILNHYSSIKLFKYLFFQKILKLNHKADWPVHFTSKISNIDNIKLGNRTYPGMSPHCYLQAKNGIIIGNNLRMGPGIKISSSNHDLSN